MFTTKIDERITERVNIEIRDQGINNIYSGSSGTWGSSGSFGTWGSPGRKGRSSTLR